MISRRRFLQSAAAAGEAYGVRSFHDVRELAAQEDIDAGKGNPRAFMAWLREQTLALEP